jgi:hypothetical protein
MGCALARASWTGSSTTASSGAGNRSFPSVVLVTRNLRPAQSAGSRAVATYCIRATTSCHVTGITLGEPSTPRQAAVCKYVYKRCKWMRLSECPDGAYDAPTEGSLPAAVGVEPDPGEFPVAVLSVIRKDPPRGVPGRSARQVDDEVGVLGHCLLLCLSSLRIQVEVGGKVRVTDDSRRGRQGGTGTRRAGSTVAGIAAGKRFVAASRSVLAAGGYGGVPPGGMATARMRGKKERASKK